MERRRQPSGNGPQEPPDPVRSAFVMAVQVMQAGRASLLLRQNLEPVMTIAAAVGITPAIIPTVRVVKGHGIAGLVAERGYSLLGSVANQTFLSTPIITRLGIEGVLNLTERLGGRQYTSLDLSSTSAVAGHIAELLQYRREALVDPVSGLPNRRAFEDALQRELSRSERSDRQFSVVFLDVDGLKAVNDRYGHAAGDDLIRSVGRALQGVIRPYDFAAHYGGDEFALLLADTRDGETSVTRRLTRVSFQTSEQIQGEYSVSIGIARFPVDGTDAETLLKVADARMYQYKQNRGRGRQA